MASDALAITFDVFDAPSLTCRTHNYSFPESKLRLGSLAALGNASLVVKGMQYIISLAVSGLLILLRRQSSSASWAA